MSKIQPLTTNAKSHSGQLVRSITDKYKLHNSNKFVKTTNEYCLRIQNLSPSSLKLFNTLLHKNLDHSNRLTIDGRDNSVSLNKKFIEDNYYELVTKNNPTIKQIKRRVQECLLELKNEGLIDRLEVNDIYIVNPLIATKAKTISKDILSLFANYEIMEFDGKKVYEKYNLESLSYQEFQEIIKDMEENPTGSMG